MPSTNYPKGVSVSTATRDVAGELYAESLVVAGNGSFGSLTVGTATGWISGNIIAIPVLFASGSAAQTLCVGVPFAGNIVGAFVTIGSVSAVASQYTVQVGSAGAVAVASVTNTLTAAFSQEALTTTTAAVTTASGLKVIRANQGTAGETSLLLLLQKS